LSLTPVVTHAEDPNAGLLAWWLCTQNHVREGRLDAFRGGPDGRLEGGVFLRAQEAPTALVFDGRRACVRLTDDLSEAGLPTAALTAEAWVKVNKPLPWGGLVGALQDNGDYERGWLLGFVNDHFAVALAGGTRARMTYLQAKDAFVPGAWHHVVGTYDGAALRLFVDGALQAESREQSGAILYPPQAPYIIGAYQDENEFYGLDGEIHEVRVFDRALSATEIGERHTAMVARFPRPAPPRPTFRALSGPFAEWTGPGTLAVSWETARPMPTILEFADAPEKSRRIAESTPATEHRVELPDIARDTVCRYRLVGQDEDGAAWPSKVYAFDSTFDYQVTAVPERPSPYADTAWSRRCAEAADRMVARLGSDQGYALVLGAEDGCLAYELARRSRMNVVVVEPDAARVATMRRLLDQAGLYGVRISVQQQALNPLPYGQYFANLIVSESSLKSGVLPPSAGEVFRCLRPAGGLVLLGQPAGAPGSLKEDGLRAWFASGEMEDLEISRDGGLWVAHRRPALAGAGDWSHLYGGTDNSACSKDELATGDLGVLWWGEPGPRPMPDRGPRNPSSLSANGRLYVQGDRILFGMDAYNGSILWSMQAPEVRR
ncbi:MAG: hypothetical protein KDM81_14345, partial [Verrucomicrobiae bacterium]|nr:hypothetical protein [Verrucomicrobiae bacterium]